MQPGLSRAVVVGWLVSLLGVPAVGTRPAWAQTPARRKESPALPGCQTPERTFAAAQQARKKGDWTAYFKLCDEYSLNAYTGQLIAWYSMKFFATPEALKTQPVEEQKDFATMKKVLERHGVTDEDCRGFLKDQPSFPELNFTSAWFRRIKDKPRFNAEMIAAMRSQRDYWNEAQQVFQGARLESLKIKGDKANADVRFSDGHKEKIEFRRVKGAWLLCYPVQELPGGYGGTY